MEASRLLVRLCHHWRSWTKHVVKFFFEMLTVHGCHDSVIPLVYLVILEGLVYGWVWGQNIMLVCHRRYVVQFIAFLRGLELLPCIIEFEDFIYSWKTWDFADWSRVVIPFDRRVRPSSKHYTPASLCIAYYYVHLAEDWILRVKSKSLRTSV